MSRKTGSGLCGGRDAAMQHRAAPAAVAGGGANVHRGEWLGADAPGGTGKVRRAL